MKLDNLNINIYQMYYFIQVIDSGNYSKASQILNVSTSTISKSIQSLEQNLNLQLFFRNKKNLYPTDTGIYLYERWRNILNNIEESLEHARRHVGGSSDTLHIGTLDSHRSEAYLLDYLDQFHSQTPNCDVSIESAPPEILHKKLQNHEFDLIFTVRYDTETNGWNDCCIQILNECPLVVCMRPANPLAQKDALEISDLKNCDLIVISSLHVPSYNKMLIQLCKNYGFMPNIIYNTSSANSQIYNLRKPNSVFICDQYHRDYGSTKLVYRTLKNTASGIAMVWEKNNTNKSLRSFLSMFHHS